MTPMKDFVRLIVVAVCVVYSVMFYVADIAVDSGWRALFAFLPPAASILAIAYDKFVWRWSFVQKFNKRPRIDGLWTGTLTPHPDSHIPPGGNWGPIPVYLVVEQSYWGVSAAMFTRESLSYSRASTFSKHGDSTHSSLSFMYDNSPRQEHRARSPRHSGSCNLKMSELVPTRIEGEYYTDRFTQGTLTLSLVDRSTDYADYSSIDTYIRTKFTDRT